MVWSRDRGEEEGWRKGDMSIVGNGEGKDMVGRGRWGWIEVEIIFCKMFLVMRGERSRWVWVDDLNENGSFCLEYLDSAYVAGQTCSLKELRQKNIRPNFMHTYHPTPHPLLRL